MYCSLHPLGGCFLYVTRIIYMNLIKYNVYIRCVNVFHYQYMRYSDKDNFQEFLFKSVLMSENTREGDGNREEES